MAPAETAAVGENPWDRPQAAALEADAKLLHLLLSLQLEDKTKNSDEDNEAMVPIYQHCFGLVSVAPQDLTSPAGLWKHLHSKRGLIGLAQQIQSAGAPPPLSRLVSVLLDCELVIDTRCTACGSGKSSIPKKRVPRPWLTLCGPCGDGSSWRMWCFL